MEMLFISGREVEKPPISKQITLQKIQYA